VYKSARLIFGVPSPPYRDAAREAALIAHETTHLLMYKLTQGQSFFGNGLKEWWALGEAYPDYFGLYYRSRQLGNDSTWVHPVFSEYVAMETSLDLPRDVSAPAPNYSGYGHVNYVGLEEGGSINEYDNSVIFSGALLDFDRNDDSENSASFIIESLSNLPVTPTFRSGRDALMIAASACAISQQPDTYECCESQACDADVAGAFASRGIGEPEEGIVLADEPEARPPLPTTPILDVHPTYPNPFSVDAHVRYELRRPESVRIRVYDAGGRLVDRIQDRPMSTGSHTFTWSPRNQPPGAYFFEITAGMHIKRGSMILVK
jgi:hypothetical protein